VGNHLKHQSEKSPKRGELDKRRSAGLSSCEVEVLQLIAKGKANKETAAELGISIKTVETSSTPDAETEYPRHGGAHPLRSRGRHHREQRAVDHCLVWPPQII
jgi:FixJ family two-component response regulator